MQIIEKRIYLALPDSKILFICTFDPYRKGLARYTFKQICKESPDICLNDGTEKIFYNCTYKGDDLPKEMHNLYGYIQTGQVNDGLTERIEKAVSVARKRDEWRSMYMKERAIFMELKEEGREEGIEYRDREKISDMLKRGKSAEAIADFCDYPMSLILDVQKSMLAEQKLLR